MSEGVRIYAALSLTQLTLDTNRKKVLAIA